MMGTGTPVHFGDVAFKCNFAHINDSAVVVKRRVDRKFEH